MMPRLSAHMTVMQAAAQKAAKRLLRDFNEVENFQVSMKGPGGFCQPGGFARRAEHSRGFGEGASRLRDADGGIGRVRDRDKWTWRWIVDPLDGTTNFLHGIPHWAISIALERRLPDNLGTEIAAAVVYSPVNNELFWAEKGVGAYVNDKRLRVSARREMRDAVFATGIPFAITTPNHRLGFARTLSTLMPQVAGIRRFGSAALDLAWVAAGRYDGYWEMGVHAWDIAAGMLIVREAGGYATDGEGKDVVARTVVAGNPHMHPKLLEVVQDGLAASKG